MTTSTIYFLAPKHGVHVPECDRFLNIGLFENTSSAIDYINDLCHITPGTWFSESSLWLATPSASINGFLDIVAVREGSKCEGGKWEAIADTHIPRNRDDFIRSELNETALFHSVVAYTDSGRIPTSSDWENGDFVGTISEIRDHFFKQANTARCTWLAVINTAMPVPLLQIFAMIKGSKDETLKLAFDMPASGIFNKIPMSLITASKKEKSNMDTPKAHYYIAPTATNVIPVAEQFTNMGLFSSLELFMEKAQHHQTPALSTWLAVESNRDNSLIELIKNYSSGVWSDVTGIYLQQAGGRPELCTDVNEKYHFVVADVAKGTLPCMADWKDSDITDFPESAIGTLNDDIRTPNVRWIAVLVDTLQVKPLLKVVSIHDGSNKIPFRRIFFAPPAVFDKIPSDAAPVAVSKDTHAMRVLREIVNLNDPKEIKSVLSRDGLADAVGAENFAVIRKLGLFFEAANSCFGKMAPVVESPVPSADERLEIQKQRAAGFRGDSVTPEYANYILDRLKRNQAIQPTTTRLTSELVGRMAKMIASRDERLLGLEDQLQLCGLLASAPNMSVFDTIQGNIDQRTASQAVRSVANIASAYHDLASRLSDDITGGYDHIV